MLRLATLLALWATPALADFQKITEKDQFLQALDGRALNIGLFKLAISVLPDGQIKGSAVGWDITGTWNWENGLFCREMDWSGMPIDYDCQMVELNEDQMRFTSEAGKGASADFRLR